jgi:hypothetical protein
MAILATVLALFIAPGLATGAFGSRPEVSAQCASGSADPACQPQTQTDILADPAAQ